MRRPVLPILAVLLLFGHGRLAGAEEGPFDAAWRARTAQLVVDLEALAKRAQKSKLYRSRDEVCERILRFDPDHEAARKWLKYKRDKQGRWARKGRYKPPRNFGKAGRTTFRDRARALGDSFAQDAFALLARHEGSVASDTRARAIRDVLAVAPHRNDARTANREVQTAEGTWMLEESVRGREGRRGLATAAQHALDAVKEPRRVRPTENENKVRIGWTGILQGSRVRMLGTNPRDELERCHRTAEAVFGLMDTVFGEPPARVNGLTIFVLMTDDERKTLLANHPKATDAYRKVSGRRASSWFPKTNVAWIKAGVTGRLEWSTRQPLATLLRRTYGVTAKHGWAFEGFGLYLSYLLTGSRGTFFVRPTGYNDGAKPKTGQLWERLRAEGASWRDEARAMFAANQGPNVHLLFGKGTNAMTMEELLYAYVLAAYILEGHPGKATAILKAIGKDKKRPAEVFGRVLGVDLEGLDLRLRRWLAETR